jgi:hypothetical protein
MSMRIQIQLRIVTDDDGVIRADEILRLDKGDDRLEAIGLSLGEAKAVLAGIQERGVTAQAASVLARHRCCEFCGRGLLNKGSSRIQFRTAFGTVPLASPRLHRCRCQPSASKTFSPLTALFTEHTAPERLYLETKWAPLIACGATAQLLKEILPIGSTANACTIRRHRHRVAARQEADLGRERPDPSETPLRPVPLMPSKGRIRSSSALTAATSGTGTTRSATLRSASARPCRRTAGPGTSAWSTARRGRRRPGLPRGSALRGSRSTQRSRC